MRTLILYKSKHGATREYVQYLHQEIKDSFICYINDFKIENLKEYEYVIIGCPTYIGQVDAYTYLVNHWEYFKNKKVFVFTVGLKDPNDRSSIESYNRIPPNIRKKIQYRKLPGRIDYQQLNLLEKLILKMVNVKAPDKIDPTATDPILSFVRLHG